MGKKNYKASSKQKRHPLTELLSSDLTVYD